MKKATVSIVYRRVKENLRGLSSRPFMETLAKFELSIGMTD